jgi:condensin complex subunit 1
MHRTSQIGGGGVALSLFLLFVWQELVLTVPFLKSRCASVIPGSTLSKILDLLVSSLSAAADIAHADIESDDQDGIKHNKQLLEVYAFLLMWTIAAVETKATEKQASAPARGRKGAAKPKGGKDAAWDATAQLITAMDVMSKVMKLKLSRIFVTAPERDTFISLFTRPTYLILENEQRIKSTTIKMHAFKVLCIAVKHHGHATGKSESTKWARNITDVNSGANIHCAESDILRTFVGTNGRVSTNPV